MSDMTVDFTATPAEGQLIGGGTFAAIAIFVLAFSIIFFGPRLMNRVMAMVPRPEKKQNDTPNIDTKVEENSVE